MGADGFIDGHGVGGSEGTRIVLVISKQQAANSKQLNRVMDFMTCTCSD